MGKLDSQGSWCEIQLELEPEIQGDRWCESGSETEEHESWEGRCQDVGGTPSTCSVSTVSHVGVHVISAQQVRCSCPCCSAGNRRRGSSDSLQAPQHGGSGSGSRFGSALLSGAVNGVLFRAEHLTTSGEKGFTKLSI